MDRRSVLTVAVAVAVVAVAVAVCGAMHYLSLQKQGVLFRGAYAVYNGSMFLGFMFQSVSVRAEVVDFNSTHVLIRVETATTSALFGSETKTNKTVEERWFPRDFYSLLTYRGEEEEYVEFLGRTRRCKVYVNSTDVMDIAYYVDKETAWPIKIVITIKAFNMDIPLELVDTNVFKK